MTRKKAELRWRAIANYYNAFSFKFGDVRYCIKCKTPQPKSELKPDYITSFVHTWIECKNSDSTGNWAWSEIGPKGQRSNQRDWLTENGGWLFIELGTGRAPKGKGAFLVPWIVWLKTIEPVLLERKQQSISFETRYNKDGSLYRNRLGADQLLADYRLEWAYGQWIIPKGHRFWLSLLNKIKFIEAKIRNQL